MKTLFPSYFSSAIITPIKPVSLSDFHPITVEASKYRGVALWVVYGPLSTPTIMCCQVSYNTFRELLIWGYGPPKRKKKGEAVKSGGFFRLGTPLDAWRDSEENVVFFAHQHHAMSYLAWVTQPKEQFFVASAASPSRPWPRDPDPAQTFIQRDPDPLPVTQLTEKALSVKSRDEMIFGLLRRVRTPEEIYRIFTRVRSKLIEIYHYDGAQDSTISHVMHLTGFAVRRVREKLNIGPEFEEAYHLAIMEQAVQEGEEEDTPDTAA